MDYQTVPWGVERKEMVPWGVECEEMMTVLVER
jgi:hypothetical protein